MKKTILKTAAIMLILAGMMISCGKEKEDNEIVSLKGTKWKLAGIMDVQTGILKELEPKNCERCYTLEFDTDSTAHGQSSSNDMLFDISKMPPTIWGTEVSEMEDGNLYMDLWLVVNSYNIKGNQLNFSCKKDEINFYLIFNPV